MIRPIANNVFTKANRRETLLTCNLSSFPLPDSILNKGERPDRRGYYSAYNQ